MAQLSLFLPFVPTSRCPPPSFLPPSIPLSLADPPPRSIGAEQLIYMFVGCLFDLRHTTFAEHGMILKLETRLRAAAPLETVGSSLAAAGELPASWDLK